MWDGPGRGGRGPLSEYRGSERVNRRRRQKLLDILVIALCAGHCGIDDWAGVELFATLKENWFRTFLELPAASHPTTPSGESSVASIRLHRCLDVTYNDDASRIRKDHGPQNMTVLRRLAVNLLRQIELGPKKVSLRGRLIMANHDSAFMLRALGF